MPKVTLTFSDTNPMPEALKAFKTSDTTADVWVNTDQDAVAAELNPSLAANRDSLKTEKDTIKLKYDALVSTSSADDVKTAKRIAELEAKIVNPIPEADKAILDAVKSVKSDATPDFIKQAIQEFPVISEKLSLIEQNQTNDALFQASGFKNKKVFETLVKNEALNPNLDSFVWKDVTDSSGNTTKVPFAKVKTAVDGKVELPFADYAKANQEWTAFMPALNNGETATQSWTPMNPNDRGFDAPTQQTGLPANNYLDAVATGMAKLNEPKKADTK